MRSVPEFIQAGIKDIPLIQELSHTIWKEYYPRILSEGQILYMLNKMYGEDSLQREMNQGVLFELVRTENTWIGYLAYQFDALQECVKLDKLYLKAEFRNRGYGKEMLKNVLKKAQNKNAKQVELRVNKYNTLAIQVYQKFGFKILKSVEVDIGGGYIMDDFVMQIECPYSKN